MLVGDRGMITQARIEEEVKPAGLDWISSLRAPAIRDLVDGGVLQLSLFDQRDIAAVTSPDFPGERLMVCRNPDLARQRTASAKTCSPRPSATLPRSRQPGRAPRPAVGTANIGLAVGNVINQHKMAKHFHLAIGETAFSFARKTEAVAAEAATDGLYVVRTSLPEEVLGDAAGAPINPSP